MGHKILLIDDDANILRMLSSVFRFEGYSVITAEGGRKGLEILYFDQEIEVVICDIKMPQMDGEKVLEQIRSRYPLIPVIMLTGFLELETAVSVMRQGAFDYVTKPVNNEKLLEVVEKAVRQKERMIEELRKKGQEEKMAALGRLTAGFAHNLNNPLSCIIAYAEFLKTKYPHEERLDKMLSAANKMYAIISAMLDKTRKEHERKRVRINLNKMLTDELEFFEADLDFKHQVEKFLDLADDLPDIEAVYSDLSQCFSNLIKNALDAMKMSPEKKLMIRTGWNEQQLFVEIADSGCGIKKEDLPKLFEPFYSTKSKQGEDGLKGTGLGLYSSYQLMRPYGVTFDVQSEVGKGTRFRVLFPSALAIQPEAQTTVGSTV
ncbi:MAG: response regulator [bacterium]|nr:response regulator [bacterium]